MTCAAGSSSRPPWPRLDKAVSMLLGELLLQMLTKSGPADDANAPVVDFIACARRKGAAARCEDELLRRVKADLALDANDPLVSDLLCVALLLMGFRGLYIDWQEVSTLDSPINSI